MFANQKKLKPIFETRVEMLFLKPRPKTEQRFAGAEPAADEISKSLKGQYP